MSTFRFPINTETGRQLSGLVRSTTFPEHTQNMSALLEWLDEHQYYFFSDPEKKEVITILIEYLENRKNLKDKELISKVINVLVNNKTYRVITFLQTTLLSHFSEGKTTTKKQYGFLSLISVGLGKCLKYNAHHLKNSTASNTEVLLTMFNLISTLTNSENRIAKEFSNHLIYATKKFVAHLNSDIKIPEKKTLAI